LEISNLKAYFLPVMESLLNIRLPSGKSRCISMPETQETLYITSTPITMGSFVLMKREDKFTLLRLDSKKKVSEFKKTLQLATQLGLPDTKSVPPTHVD
jgi:hypothetical protein